MPTFTTVALDSLIEPKPSKLASAGKIKTKPKLENRNGNFTITRNGSDGKAESGNSPISIERKHHWTQISPALYATPEPTPLPESDSQLSSFPSSPYIVDHKRRGPRLSKTYSAVLHRESDEKNVEIGKSLEAEDIGSSKAFDTTTDSVKAEDNRVKFHDNVESKKVFDIKDSVSSDLDNIHVKILHNEHDQDHLRKHDTLEHGEIDDFFDPHDTMSLRSSSDGDTNHVVEKSLHSHTPFAEFYDAWEELANETGIQHTATDVEGELREMRSGFLYEVEKRRQAESRLNDMKSQWGRIREQLAIVGLNLPADPTILEDEPANDPGEEICRQVELLRFVSNSVGRGIARAELEVEMEAQLQSKNFEIARLLDRVHYYETVNHEMSQRNQESVETMRRLRQKRKKRQRWIWGSIGVAITLGTTALAYSYRSTGKGSSSSSSSKTNK